MRACKYSANDPSFKLNRIKLLARERLLLFNSLTLSKTLFASGPGKHLSKFSKYCQA